MSFFYPTTQQDFQKKLYAAIKDNDLEKMKKWVARGAATNLETGGYQTALHACVAYDFYDGVEYCLSFRPNIESEPARLIHSAIFQWRENILKRLIEYGFNLDYCDVDYDATPLHVAAREGYALKVRLLLQGGANPQILDQYMRTPADMADEKYPNLAAYIRSFGRKELPAPAPQVNTGWHALSEDEACHIAENPVTGYRLTEVFNFARHSYHSIARNLETGQETQVAKSFGDFTDVTMIQCAAAVLPAQENNAGYRPVHLSKKRWDLHEGNIL
jgi:hypothetical protein